MSKGAKQIIVILGLLFVVVIAIAGYVAFQKMELESSYAALQQQLQESQSREKTKIAEVKKLTNDLKNVSDAKIKVERKVKTVEKQVEDLMGQVSEATDERDRWKKRIEDVRRERDDLLSKVQELTQKRNQLEAELEEAKAAVEAAPPATAQATPTTTTAAPAVPVGDMPPPSDDQYWASVLKQKASLEAELGKLKDELSGNALEIVELKQSNADLQIELESVEHEKAEIEKEINHKESMIDSLSLELARTKNDKKYETGRVGNLNQENAQLRQQVKSLVAAKGALEKTILRITQDKEKMSKQLMETEGVIQGKIDEIWEIKESLDRTFKETQMAQPANTEVELPPIVVSSDGPAVSFQPDISEPGFNGSVVSINESNNFVIVDIGEGKGVRLGDMLSVYRDSKYVARLEVIQVRKDISAADIKDQWSSIKVGDIIR